MLDSRALGALRAGLAEGQVRFRFEGRRQGVVALWAEVYGDRQGDGTWACRVELGDGGKLSKAFSAEEEEDKFTEVLLGLQAWLNPQPKRS